MPNISLLKLFLSNRDYFQAIGNPLDGMTKIYFQLIPKYGNTSLLTLYLLEEGMSNKDRTSREDYVNFVQH